MELGDGMAYVKDLGRDSLQLGGWGVQHNSIWLQHNRVREKVVLLVNKVRVLSRNFAEKFKMCILGYGRSINMGICLTDCVLEKRII